MSAWQIEKQKHNRKEAEGHNQGSYTYTLFWHLTLKAIYWLTGLFTHLFECLPYWAMHESSFTSSSVFASQPAVHESRLTVLSASQHWPHLPHQWPPGGMLLHVDHHPATAVLQVGIFTFICTMTIPDLRWFSCLSLGSRRLLAKDRREDSDKTQGMSNCPPGGWALWSVLFICHTHGFGWMAAYERQGITSKSKPVI